MFLSLISNIGYSAAPPGDAPSQSAPPPPGDAPSQSAPPPPGDASAPVNDDLCGGKDSTDNSISCSEDVETTEAPASVSTQRPDMFSTVVVKHATTVTDWVKMGIPLAITKKYLNDPTAGGKCDHECMKAEAVSAAEAASAASAANAIGAPTAALNEAKAAAVSAAEAFSAASAAAAKGAPTAALNEAKAAAVAEAEKATAADRDSACSRLPEGETADYC